MKTIWRFAIALSLSCWAAALTVPAEAQIFSITSTTNTAGSNNQPKSPNVVDLLKASAQNWNAPKRLFLFIVPNYMMPQLVSSDPNNPPDLTTADGIAAAYGMSSNWIGHVLAIAPATMTVLNTDPGLAELPIDQLETMHPIPALFGSLTQEQFNLLAGTGLGMSDLTPDQQVLFQAILPNPFQVVSSDAVEPGLTMAELSQPGAMEKEQRDMAEFEKEVITVPPADVLRDVRLHAYLDEEYDLDSDRGSYGFGSRSSQIYTSGEKKLTLNSTMGQQQSVAAEFQKLFVSQEPNEPKPGDISWRRKDLATSVGIDGVKTVEDLVARIAKATHLELYADSNYASNPILIAGDRKYSPTAADLMQSLALCEAGTWRQVGPAYVLTNDEVGLGTRDQALKDVVSTWSNRLATADEAVASRLKEFGWMQNLLPFVGDTTDVPRDQMLKICDNGDKQYGNVKWSDLSPALQAALTKSMTDEASEMDVTSNDPQYNSQRDMAAAITDIAQSVKPDTNVNLDVNIEVALELPQTGVMSYQKFRVNSRSGSFKMPISNDPISMPEPIRGILCAPKTSDEVTKTVDMLPKLGFNALFLDVFNNGRAYFKNSAVAPETDDAGNVLNAALAEAKAKGIAVYAVVDLLCLRKDGNTARPAIWPAQFDEDLNIFGEPADVGVRRRLKENSLNMQITNSPIEGASESWVSPLDPAVRKTMPALIKDLANVSGLAGLIVQDTAPPGYDGQPDGLDTNLDLGYTESNRLAYLRQNMKDPIDLFTIGSANLWIPFEGWQGGSIQYQIPGFGVSNFPAQQDPWWKYRSDADLALLQDCYQAAFTTRPKLPLYMKERLDGLTFDPWTKATWVNQIASIGEQSQPFNYVNQQSIFTIGTASPLLTTPDSLSWLLNSYPEIFPHSPGGIALDLETGGISENVPEMLKLLTPYLKSN